MHPAVDQDRAAYTKILRAPGSAPLSLLHSCPGEVRMIPSRGGPAPSIHVFAPRAQLRRGVAHHHRTAHLQLAAAPVRSIKTGPGCGAGGRWRYLAGLRDDAPSKARGADGSRAGRRPAAHTAARPIKSGHTAPGTPAAPQATKTPEPEAVPGSGGGGWGIRTPEGLHPTRFPSVRHRPLGESSVHIVPDNHKRKMSSRANPGQWSRSQARHFKEKGITWGPNPPSPKQSGQQTTPIRHAPTHQPQRRWHPRVGPRPRRLAEPKHVDVGGNANKNPIEHEGGGGLT